MEPVSHCLRLMPCLIPGPATSYPACKFLRATAVSTNLPSARFAAGSRVTFLGAAGDCLAGVPRLAGSTVLAVGRDEPPAKTTAPATPPATRMAMEPAQASRRVGLGERLAAPVWLPLLMA